VVGNSSAPPPGLHHQGGGTVFPRPRWEGLGEWAELVQCWLSMTIGMANTRNMSYVLRWMLFACIKYRGFCL